jgi:hypothetical protein
VNDIPLVPHGRSIMYAVDTSVLNTHTTAGNIRVNEQYFKMSNLFINPSKTHYILFHTKQYRQESNLKILMKNSEILKVKSTNFLGVVQTIKCT